MKSAPWMLVLLAVLRSEAADIYRLDSGNTQVSFAVQRLGIQWVTARFADISGNLVLDRRGASSRVEVSVGIASLDANEPRWNDRLRSAEWLDANRYPRMSYRSYSIEFSADRAIATGELTLHGATRPVVLNVTLMNCSAAALCQFTAHGRIKRSDFGLPHGFWSGGDQVDISISGAAANSPR